jgi:hypothetical protein
LIDENDLDRPLREALRDALDDGEPLRWLGNPSATMILSGSWPVWLFCAFLIGFSAFWMWGASGVGRGGTNVFSLFLALLGLPFLLLGIALSIVPFLAAASAKRAAYAVTDRRALIVRKRFGTYETAAFAAEELRGMRVTARADGSGDIVFAGTARPAGRMKPRRTGFLGMRNVAEAEAALRRLKAP